MWFGANVFDLGDCRIKEDATAVGSFFHSFSLLSTTMYLKRSKKHAQFPACLVTNPLTQQFPSCKKRSIKLIKISYFSNRYILFIIYIQEKT